MSFLEPRDVLPGCVRHRVLAGDDRRAGAQHVPVDEAPHAGPSGPDNAMILHAKTLAGPVALSE